MKKVIIQSEPIDVPKIMSEIGTDEDGAIVSFTGRARNHSHGKSVKYLQYEIYNGMARKELEKIAKEAEDKWSLNTCIVVHRYGKINVGEPSIFIAVSTPHRKESYSSSQYIIDEVKERVPIWKKEFYTDNSEWVISQK